MQARILVRHHNSISFAMDKGLRFEIAILRIFFMSTSFKVALRSMPQNRFDDKSALVQLMSWCRQATMYGYPDFVAIWRH